MNKTVIKRLNAVESRLQSRERPFYGYCVKWHTEPESRPQLALEANLSIEAADYIFSTGLKYGKPADDRFPFASWSMDELKKAAALTE